GQQHGIGWEAGSRSVPVRALFGNLYTGPNPVCRPIAASRPRKSSLARFRRESVYHDCHAPRRPPKSSRDVVGSDVRGLKACRHRHIAHPATCWIEHRPLTRDPWIIVERAGTDCVIEMRFTNPEASIPTDKACCERRKLEGVRRFAYALYLLERIR